MTGERGTANRFRDLIHRRLLPGLAELGFGDRLPGSLAAADAQGVRWLLDLDVAPWSAPDRMCFTVRWGVHVPGVDEAVGDPEPEVPTVETCVVEGRLTRGAGREPQWFEVRSVPRPVAGLVDLSVANHVLGAIATEVLPALGLLSTPAEVQRHLYERLGRVRGAPSGEELRTIRRIAALSLLLGDRGNAARWLDHLEARSCVSMAPDVVAERLLPLRERLAS